MTADHDAERPVFHAQTTIVTDVRAAAAARAFIDDNLKRWNLGHCRDQAMLAASELVTNAVLHGNDPIVLTLIGDQQHVRLEVHDAGPELPSARRPGGHAGGYGLRLVDRACSKWGILPTQTGKLVWCECFDTHGPGHTGVVAGQDDQSLESRRARPSTRAR